jgi:tetratricopeptide (TPR) repeat protein
MLASVAGALADGDPLVRDAAVLALSQADPEIRAKLLAPLAGDPVRTVRIDAGRALAGEPTTHLDPAQARAASAALEEWRASQAVNLDRPEARLNLGVLAAELGDTAVAEAECRAALDLEPRIPTGYVNLADIQRAAGREEESRATLREGLKIAPGNAMLWHALGLALVRQRQPTEALDALKKAATLEPGNARFVEVYRIARAELTPSKPTSAPRFR